MEHKVQNSLDTIECNLSTGSELCGIRLMTGRCKDCNTKEDLKTIQNLIDCQLTIDEIDYILDFVIRDFHESRNIRDYVYTKNVIDKLEKQKGMWKNE